MGDGVAAAFASAPEALAAAVDAQVDLSSQTWGVTGPLRARVGIHTGEGVLVGEQYTNQPLNRCARLMAAGHGGQVLVSGTTEALVRNALPERVELIDLGEHRLRDLAQPMRVFQVVHGELARTFPPVRTLDAFGGNLPFQVSSFVGRERELERTASALMDRRVVTLTGVGGVGKTRLALQVAAEVLPRFADGAWLCELAPVLAPDGLLDVLAALFEISPRAGQPLEQTLVEFLQRKELLLVLDNCEHLLAPVAHLVATIEQQCPAVRMLATSREGLDIDGERIFVVSSLAVPADDAIGVGAVGACAAVRLFVERARAVRADFELTAGNAEHIAGICRQLDGIALAIELAAARVQTFTPAEIMNRLDRRFRLLTGSRRTAIERHQTLRAAIDWSYDLLDTAERLLLDRLGVFVGGFTLEAAEVVTAGDGVEDDAVWEILAGLVARSLVAVGDDEVETRYRLLETIRQYALDHLADQSEVDRLRHEHARYFAAFGEDLVPSFYGPDETRATLRLDRELDNLRAALDWAMDAGDLDTAIRLANLSKGPGTGTGVPPWTSGLHRIVKAAVPKLLAMPGVAEHERYPTVLCLGALHLIDEELADAALDAERRTGSVPEPGLWLVKSTRVRAGDFDQSISYLEHAVATARAHYPRAVGYLLSVLASTRAESTDPALAIGEAEEAVNLARESGAPSLQAIAFAAAAKSLVTIDPIRASSLARDAVALEDSLVHHGAGVTYIIAASVMERLASPHERLELYGKSLRQVHWGGNIAYEPLYPLLARIADLVAAMDPETAATIDGAIDSRGNRWAPRDNDAAIEYQRALDTYEAKFSAQQLQALRARGAAMTDTELVDIAQRAIARFLSATTELP
jgi:predicted ATPase